MQAVDQFEGGAQLKVQRVADGAPPGEGGSLKRRGAQDHAGQRGCSPGGGSHLFHALVRGQVGGHTGLTAQLIRLEAMGPPVMMEEQGNATRQAPSHGRGQDPVRPGHQDGGRYPIRHTVQSTSTRRGLPPKRATST